MYKSFKKPCLILLSAIIAAMLVLACAFMLSPKTTAHADAEETHDHSTMTELTARPAGGNLTAGAYYLGDNISGNITVSGTVTLCLNGHNVTGDGNDSVITVSQNATFTLCDCKDAGIITGGNAERGGGVLVSGGAFTMSGGTISSNTATSGGGVFVWNSGTFIMNGGTIRENIASSGGGGVFVNTTFTMTGGTISENTAESYGGGVYLNGSTTFKMSGGTISRNTANTGGGVFLANGSTFEVFGAPNVTGNEKTDGSDNNVDVNYDICTVTGKLTAGAEIGVNRIGEIATGYNQSDAPSNYFIPDDAEKCVYLSDEPSGTVTIGNHNWENAPWMANHLAHWRACQNGCGTWKDNEFHNFNQEVVGEMYLKSAATCTEKAVCYKSCECGAYGEETFEYGKALGHSLTHHEAVAATDEEDGNTEYWSCGECDNYFSDETGENEITDKSSVVLNRLKPTTPAPDNNGSDQTPTAPAEEPKSYWWLFLLLIPIAIVVGGVMLGIYDYKKQKENNK
ncbi:MAG: hypothetical protein K2O28_06170 [Clostridia bacterium]|nr:hypothetical protein [Clostridia bacterium]